MSKYQRPVIEMSQETFAKLKAQAALEQKPLSQYLCELILIGYQHSVERSHSEVSDLVSLP